MPNLCLSLFPCIVGRARTFRGQHADGATHPDHQCTDTQVV